MSERLESLIDRLEALLEAAEHRQVWEAMSDLRERLDAIETVQMSLLVRVSELEQDDGYGDNFDDED